MKPQDVFFLIIFAILIYKRNYSLLSASGILCLVFAIPLFAFWVFFTAERLIWYGALLLLTGIFFRLYKEINEKD